MVGARIKKRREQLGLTQDELAQTIGYKSRSSINKIEKGENELPQSKIVVFAKALKTTPAYLMGWADDAEIKKLTPAENDMSELYADLAKLSEANIDLVRNLVKGLLAQDGSNK